MLKSHLHFRVLSCHNGFSRCNIWSNLSQEVAVKRMTATKTKEFAAEMKVLCKVHHSNLVIPFVCNLLYLSKNSSRL